MADNFAITPGVGVTLGSDEVGGVHHQRVKLSLGADGTAIDAPGEGTNGLDVDVTRVQGTVAVSAASALPVSDNGGFLSVDDGAGSLTVDAPATSPVGVRLSDGTAFITALPVTDNGGNLSVDDGGGSLTVDGTVAATQSGTWTVAITGAAFTGDALKVTGAVSSAATQTDKSTFTEGSGSVSVAGAVFNDTISSAPAEDQAAALRITQRRGLHVNLRKDDGAEIGIAALPIRVDPTGTTTQPVSNADLGSIKTAVELADDVVGTVGSAAPTKATLVAGSDGTNARALKTNASGAVAVQDDGGSLTVDGTVTANQGGAPWAMNVTQFGGAAVVAAAAGVPRVGIVAADGSAITQASPLSVLPAGNVVRTVRRATVAFTASQTDQALLTPAGGKRLIIESIVLKVGGGGEFAIFWTTESSANAVLDGNFAVDDIVTITFPNGHPSDAVDVVLRYTSGAGASGRVTVFGYEV